MNSTKTELRSTSIGWEALHFNEIERFLSETENQHKIAEKQLNGT